MVTSQMAELEDEKISIEFDRLSLKEALEKISSNYGYVMDSGKEGNKITRITIQPRGEESRNSGNRKHNTCKKEPFKFEFDPMESYGSRRVMTTEYLLRDQKGGSVKK